MIRALFVLLMLTAIGVPAHAQEDERSALESQLWATPSAGDVAEEPLGLPDHLSGINAPALGAGLSHATRPTERAHGAVGATLPFRPAAENRTGVITGRVTVEGTGQPLAGAQVQIPGLNVGSLTSSDGQYRIEGVPAGEFQLTVVMLGYGRVERSITVVSGQTQVLNIELRRSALALDAVVVTGTPGAQQARSIGNVVGRLDAVNLQEMAPQATPETLLRGGIPGVTVATGTGQVGTGSVIRIRGAGSIALSSQPLIYIDGIRANNDALGALGDFPGPGANAPPSRLNDLSPEMIESIEVIKGPAAATLYGTEASNGVINIITKQGTQGRAVFNMSTRVGQTWLPDPKNHWPELFFRCRGLGVHPCQAGDIVGVNLFMNDYVTLGLDHTRIGLPRGVSGSVAGGQAGVNYYFALDYDVDEGPIPIDSKNSLSGVANLGWTPRDDLTINLGIQAMQSEMLSGSAVFPAHMASLWGCTAGGCEPGSGTPAALDGAFRGFIAYVPDVVHETTRGGQDVNRNVINFTARHEPFSWLSHRIVAGMDRTQAKNHLLIRHLQGRVGNAPRFGARDVTHQNSQFLTLDYSATATYQLGRAELATSGGAQYYDKESEFVRSRGEDFAVPILESISSGQTRITSDGYLRNKTFGVYLQEQFSWDNRLFLTAAVRGDDNSAFGADFSFVVYPKVSASWVISEESFMENIDWLSSLRLRSAWGRAGQQPDLFAAAQLYSPVEQFQGQGGITPRTTGNPEVEPEIGEELELGFDASIFDERFSVELTYYDQKRKKALINVPVRPSTGFPGTQFRNIGEVQSTGWELGLNWDAYRGRDVGLHMAVALSLHSNEITDMGGLGPQRLSTSNPSTGWARQRFVQGFPLGAIFQPRVVSADVENPGQANARAFNVMCESGPPAWPGTDLTRGGGPPVPCSQAGAPEVYRGTPIPTREVSTNATLTLFRDLRLYAQVDYVGGHTMIDGHVAAAHSFFRNTRAIIERIDPIPLAYEALGSLGTNQGGLHDASFARLRRVSATYQLPDGLTGQIGASRAVFSLSGENLAFLWRASKDGWGRKILDPESRAGQTRNEDPGGLTAYYQNVLPAFKRVTAQLRVTF